MPSENGNIDVVVKDQNYTMMYLLIIARLVVMPVEFPSTRVKN